MVWVAIVNVMRSMRWSDRSGGGPPVLARILGRKGPPHRCSRIDCWGGESNETRSIGASRTGDVVGQLTRGS